MKRRSKSNPAAVVCWFGIVAAACGASPKPAVQYVQAEPTTVNAPSMPPIVAMARGPATAGERRAGADDQVRKIPRASEPKPVLPPSDVIAQANKIAAQEPEETGFFDAIQIYDYSPGRLYRIYGAPKRVTDIALRPGEKVVGQPASGDILRWKLQFGTSIEGGQEQQHVYVKPQRPGLTTNLLITTTQRTYRCELVSFEEAYMVAVQWSYPEEEFAASMAQAKTAAEAQKNFTPVSNLANINPDYRIEVLEGEPKWKPTLVYDDGAKTFIRFPRAMRVREAPALWLERNGQSHMVNYRPKDGTYIIDRLIDHAVLRLGQDDEAEVVRITRLRRR